MEAFDVPGETMLGCDSHTPHAGACGMLAIGAGGFEVGSAMAGEPYRLTMPEVVNVKLTGAYKPWVSAKDVVLELLHRFDVKWAKNKVLEYTGPALKELTVPSRGTIANMGTELGATASVFPADGMTKQFLTAQARGKDFKPLAADSAAKYDDTVDIDLGTIAPPTRGPSVRTFNRNFEGRSGTADDLVYLCSPETAAATAVRGVITDPRELGKFPSVKEPVKYPVDTSGFEWPPKDRASVQIIGGPHIAPLPVAARPQDPIDAEALVRPGDNIST